MDLKPTPLQAEKYAKEQKFLVDLYTLLEVGKEQEMSRRLLQGATGADPQRIDFVLLALQRANAYTMRFAWRDPKLPEGPGKKAYWTLQMPFEEAKKILDATQREHLIAAKNRYARSTNIEKARAAQAAKRNGVVRNGEDQTVYSVGEDMPKGIGIKTFSPADKQPKALVEAARQYGPKLAAAKKAFDLLSHSGIDVDEKAFFDLMKVPQDDRLETVSLVLPYIEQLEQQVKDLKKQRQLVNTMAADTTAAEAR